MGTLKTKDAADLISVSQTTIKRWASTFPDFFRKDRFGHYMFSENDIRMLMHIKERIDHGELLDQIDVKGSNPRSAAQEEPSAQYGFESAAEELLIRMEQVESSLSQKADEVVSVQLLHQREEIEELRQMIAQIAAAVETIRTPDKTNSLPPDKNQPASVKLQSVPKKRGLLRSIFSFL